MAGIVETAAAPAEKIVETIAKPLGLAASVRKVPDWVWLALSAVALYMAYRWYQRRKLRVALTGVGVGATGSNTGIMPPSLTTGIPVPTVAGAVSPPTATVPAAALPGLLGGGIASIGRTAFNGTPVYSPKQLPDGTIY